MLIENSRVTFRLKLLVSNTCFFAMIKMYKKIVGTPRNLTFLLDMYLCISDENGQTLMYSRHEVCRHMYFKSKLVFNYKCFGLIRFISDYLISIETFWLLLFIWYDLFEMVKIMTLIISKKLCGCKWTWETIQHYT